MNKTTTTKYDNVLDEQTLQLLSDAPAVLHTAPEQMQNLRDRVMQRVDDAIDNTLHTFLTIRNSDGTWIEIAPKIKKKVLFENPETGTESYLLKAEPEGEVPSHVHEIDEHCLVLEGELSFDGIRLKAGDYHFAPAGSEHNVARTDVGALVYIQTGPEGFQPSL